MGRGWRGHQRPVGRTATQGELHGSGKPPGAVLCRLLAGDPGRQAALAGGWWFLRKSFSFLPAGRERRGRWVGGSCGAGRPGAGAPAGWAQASRRKEGRLHAGGRLLELRPAAQRGVQRPSRDTPATAAPAPSPTHSQLSPDTSRIPGSTLLSTVSLLQNGAGGPVGQGLLRVSRLLCDQSSVRLWGQSNTSSAWRAWDTRRAPREQPNSKRRWGMCQLSQQEWKAQRAWEEDLCEPRQAPSPIRASASLPELVTRIISTATLDIGVSMGCVDG